MKTRRILLAALFFLGITLTTLNCASDFSTGPQLDAKVQPVHLNEDFKSSIQPE